MRLALDQPSRGLRVGWLWVFLLAVCACLSVSRAIADTPPGDANCDGAVNSADLSAVVDAIFNGGCAGADVNGDGRVTGADLPAEVKLLAASVQNSPTPTPSPTHTGTPGPSATSTRTPTITSTPSRTGTPSITGVAQEAMGISTP